MKIDKKNKTENEIDNEASENNADNIPDQGNKHKEHEHEIFEANDNDDEGMDAGDAIALMQEQVASLQDKLLRNMAELENIRNRNAKALDESRQYAITAFAKDLVPVFDNIARAMDHVPNDLSDEIKSFVEGIQMTSDEFHNALKKHGINCIKPSKGEKFDYNKHNAISQIVTDEVEPGTIVDTMQVGYQIHDRLLRPASVCVAKK